MPLSDPQVAPVRQATCPLAFVLPVLHTEDAGLPYFDRAAVIANGNWYYTSALESMGAKLCFRYCLVNIGPIYT